MCYLIVELYYQVAEMHLEPCQTPIVEILKAVKYFHENAQSFIFDRVANAFRSLNLYKSLVSKLYENLMISPENEKLLKFNGKSTRKRRKIYSKLTLKTLSLTCSGIFIINYLFIIIANISYLLLVLLLLLEQVFAELLWQQKYRTETSLCFS